MQQEMGIKITPAAAHIDNIGAGFMAEQKICNKRSKHIDIKYHYCREQVQEFKNFDLNYVPTGDNVSDIFTKPLDAPVHHKHEGTKVRKYVVQRCTFEDTLKVRKYESTIVLSYLRR
jgi:hypothetical protein